MAALRSTAPMLTTAAAPPRQDIGRDDDDDDDDGELGVYAPLLRAESGWDEAPDNILVPLLDDHEVRRHPLPTGTRPRSVPVASLPCWWPLIWRG